MLQKTRNLSIYVACCKTLSQMYLDRQPNSTKHKNWHKIYKRFWRKLWQISTNLRIWGLLYIEGGKEEDIKRVKEYFGKSYDLKNTKGCESYKFINERRF